MHGHTTLFPLGWIEQTAKDNNTLLWQVVQYMQLILSAWLGGSDWPWVAARLSLWWEGDRGTCRWKSQHFRCQRLFLRLVDGNLPV